MLIIDPHTGVTLTIYQPVALQHDMHATMERFASLYSCLLLRCALMAQPQGKTLQQRHKDCSPDWAYEVVGKELKQPFWQSLGKLASPMPPSLLQVGGICTGMPEHPCMQDMVVATQIFATPTQWQVQNSIRSRAVLLLRRLPPSRRPQRPADCQHRAARTRT